MNRCHECQPFKPVLSAREAVDCARKGTLGDTPEVVPPPEAS